MTVGHHGQVVTPELLLRNGPSLAMSDAPNPLLAEDSFEEAMISDVWLCATESSVGVLIDLRMTDAFDDHDLAVLILRNPTDVRWTSRPAPEADRGRPQWFWRTTLSQRFSITEDGGVHAAIGLFVDGEDLEIQARRAEFYVGDGHLGDVPDMASDGAVDIRRRLPNWSTEFAVRDFWSLP